MIVTAATLPICGLLRQERRERRCGTSAERRDEPRGANRRVPQGFGENRLARIMQTGPGIVARIVQTHAILI
jgi:hypothetical protein